MRTYTPLRYPGGKAKIYKIVSAIIEANELKDKTYVEPFSGGFGLGLRLLLNGNIDRVIINDYDIHIYAFWDCVLNYTEEFVKKIKNANITIEEWRVQKNIYENYEDFTTLEVGFSTLFLNRTNYSGILLSGPLGGYKQEGKYKLDCRFNKEALVKLIELISKQKEKIEIHNKDAVELIRLLKSRENDLFYNFDPPYVVKGKELYLNAFTDIDHINLKKEIEKVQTKWIMTYDNTEFIELLYQNYDKSELNLQYSAGSKRKEKELFIGNFYLTKCPVKWY